MDIQIASDIKDILMEDGSIIIPSLGGFTSTYKPAVTDGVMSVVHPPSYHLTFDANQQTNDGKLIDFIREKYHVTSSAAQEAIDIFVKGVYSHFDKNEIMILPEVGRLYRDFTQKVQFLPDSTNFNADTFGLSSLNFAPISRMKPEPVKAVSVTPTTDDSVAATTSEPQLTFKEKVTPEFLTPIDDVPPPIIINKPKKYDWLPDNWRDYAPALAVSLIILLAILVWFNTRSGSNTEGVRRVENNKPNVNISPRQADATTSSGTVSQGAPPQQPTPPIQQKTDTQAITNEHFFVDKQKREEASAVKPQVYSSELTHKAIIVIGSFTNKSNIVRLKKWITEQGYVVYEKKKSNGLTEIGCEIGYSSKEEYNRILKKIKARYGDELEVYKK
ncbi:MAG: hypothetical protein JNL70_19450 [Saprospiraceae bacterium]|nr:hypothetical protein [Saprospiraceae bacterium]